MVTCYTDMQEAVLTHMHADADYTERLPNHPPPPLPYCSLAGLAHAKPTLGGLTWAEVWSMFTGRGHNSFLSTPSILNCGCNTEGDLITFLWALSGLEMALLNWTHTAT